MIIHEDDDFDEWFKLHNDFFIGQGYPATGEEFMLAVKHNFLLLQGNIADYRREDRRENCEQEHYEEQMQVWISKDKIRRDNSECPRMHMAKPPGVCCFLLILFRFFISL